MLLHRFHQLPDNLKGAAYLMMAAFGFSLMSLLIKLLGMHLHVTQILLVRQIGMIIIVAPAVFSAFPGVLKTNRLDLQVTRIFFALIAMLGGFSAIIHMPLADATAIFFAKSFFVTIFAVLILKETVGVYRWSAVIVGFLGVLLMLRPGSENFSVYGLAGVVGAAGAGVVMIIIRILSRTDQPKTILGYQAFGVGLVMLIPGIYYWQWPTVNEWILLGLLGLVSYFAQKGNIYAYKWGEASMLASLDYVRLLYATLFGYLIFDSFPGIGTWVGAGIIVAASIFTVHREAKRRKTVTPADVNGQV
jgi:drug/metabolite transporter (DMT)-like permease